MATNLASVFSDFNPAQWFSNCGEETAAGTQSHCKGDVEDQGKDGLKLKLGKMKKVFADTDLHKDSAWMCLLMMDNKIVG